eukprot:jgi/Tetstr1/454091/TSEL_041010.t1
MPPGRTPARRAPGTPARRAPGTPARRPPSTPGGAAVDIDGDAILRMLRRDAELGSKPLVDFGSMPVEIPPVLDRVFAEIIREYMLESAAGGGSAGRRGGGGEGGDGAREAIRTIKDAYTEYKPSNARGKDACLALFKDRAFLGYGRYGTVFDVVDPTDPRPGFRYAVKTVFIYPFAHRMLYDNLVNEIEIGKKMGEAGIGPRVRAVHWCKQDGGMLVMIVTDLMNRGDLAHFSQTHAVTHAHLKAVEAKLKRMHNLGYLHNDVHSRNVLVHKNDDGSFEFFLSDFGMSGEGATDSKRREEVRRVRALTSIVTRDRLRGMLYAMVADGRIRPRISLRQSRAAESAVWMGDDGSCESSGLRSSVHPHLTSHVYADGSAVSPGDVAVPVLLVQDSDNKVTMVRGAPVHIYDRQPPAVSGLSSGLSAQDVYNAAAAGVANADFGYVLVEGYAAGGEVALASHAASLGTARVHDGASFAAVAEGDTVYPYILAVDGASLKGSAASAGLAVADRTPPSGLDSVAIGAVSSTSVQLTGLDGITDGVGVDAVTITYGTADDVGDAGNTHIVLSAPGIGATYNIESLDDATTYYLWVQAADAAGNAAAAVRVGSVATPDATDPTISGFDVSQGAGGGNYTFSTSAGTVADNVDGAIDAYLVMSPSAALDASALQTLAGPGGASLQSSAKAIDYAYTSAPGTFAVGALSLSTDRYHDGTGFAAITEAAPDLYAYLLVVDAASNASSAINAGGAKAVADRTAPSFSGTLVASANGSDAITVSGLDGWSDGGSGLAGVTAHCGTTAPASDAAADVASWAALVTTVSASVASVGDASVDVPGLTANTPYYVRATASDSAGNASDAAATAAATVSTDPEESTTHTEGFPVEHTVAVPQTVSDVSSQGLDYATTLSASGATIRVRAYAVNTSNLNFFVQFTHVPTGKETRWGANVSVGGGANTMVLKRQVGSTVLDVTAPAQYGAAEAQTHTYVLRFDNSAGVLIGQAWDGFGGEVIDPREEFASSATDTYPAGDGWVVQFRVEGNGGQVALTEYAYYPLFIPDGYLAADGSVSSLFMGFDPLTQELYDSKDPATQSPITVPHALSPGNPIFVETVRSEGALTPDCVVRAFITGTDFSASDRLTLIVYDADNPGTILFGGRFSDTSTNAGGIIRNQGTQSRTFVSDASSGAGTQYMYTCRGYRVRTSSNQTLPWLVASAFPNPSLQRQVPFVGIVDGGISLPENITKLVAGAEALSGLTCTVDRVEVLTTPRVPDAVQRSDVLWMDTVYSPILADGTGGNNGMHTSQFRNNNGERVGVWYDRHKLAFPPPSFSKGAAPDAPYLPVDHLTGARFGGVDQSLIISNTARFSSVAMTAFAVFKPSGTPDPGVTRSVLANTAVSGHLFCIRDAHVQLTTSQSPYPAASMPGPGGWSVVACKVSTNAQEAWIGGVKFVSAGETTSGSNGNFAIGSEGGQSSEFFAGEVGEIILVDRSMSETEVDEVNAYLMAKWL